MLHGLSEWGAGREIICRFFKLTERGISHLFLYTNPGTSLSVSLGLRSSVSRARRGSPRAMPRARRARSAARASGQRHGARAHGRYASALGTARAISTACSSPRPRAAPCARCAIYQQLSVRYSLYARPYGLKRKDSIRYNNVGSLLCSFTSLSLPSSRYPLLPSRPRLRR